MESLFLSKDVLLGFVGGNAEFELMEFVESFREVAEFKDLGKLEEVRI